MFATYMTKLYAFCFVEIIILIFSVMCVCHLSCWIMLYYAQGVCVSYIYSLISVTVY